MWIIVQVLSLVALVSGAVSGPGGADRIARSLLGPAAAVSFGQPAGEAEFQYFAMLLNPDKSFFGCGGTLIKQAVVATAGHCLKDSAGNLKAPFAVAVGVTALNNSGWQYEYRTVKAVIRHPAFNSVTIENDIGLLVLSSPITSSIRPAALPPVNLNIPPGTPLQTAGFGLTETQQLPTQLMYATVPFVPWPQCNLEMQRLAGGNLPLSHICAGQAATRRDSCAGDSGGPLVWRRRGQPDTLVGIVSYGPAAECGAAGLNLGAYTCVYRPAIAGWINGELRRAKIVK